MKKKTHNDESLLREKLLGHEFPADEQAWEQMAALLDAAPPPVLSPDPMPGAARFTTDRAMRWLAGLCLIGALVMLVLSGPSTGQAPSPELAVPPGHTVAPPFTAKGAEHPNTPTRTETQGKNAAQKGIVLPETATPNNTLKANNKGSAPQNPKTILKSAPTDAAHPPQAMVKNRRGKPFFISKLMTSAPVPEAQPSTPPASETGASRNETLTSQTPVTTLQSAPLPEAQPTAPPASETAYSRNETLTGQAPAAALQKDAIADLKSIAPDVSPGQNATANAPNTILEEATRQQGTVAPLILPSPSMLTIQPGAARKPLHHRPVSHERPTWLGFALGGQAATVKKEVTERDVNGLTSSASQEERLIDLIPTFGLSMTHRFTPRWSVQIDLLYKKVQGYNLEAVFEASGFDVAGLYGSWSIKRYTNALRFWEMPILLKWRLADNKENVFLGLRPALVKPVIRNGSSSIINRGYGSNFLPPSDFSPSIEDGIRHHDLAVTLGCEVRVWRNLWADIRYNQGLLDLTNNAFFNHSKVDLNTDVQFTLRYYFLAQ